MPSRDVNLLVPQLRDAVPRMIAEFGKQYPDLELRVICTARSREEQFELFRKGRKVELRKLPDGTYQVAVLTVDRKQVVTWKDGYVQRSKHNTGPGYELSRAVDFGVFRRSDGKYLTAAQYYLPLRDLARAQGLLSGFDFPGTWKDAPHVEVPG